MSRGSIYSVTYSYIKGMPCKGFLTEKLPGCFFLAFFFHERLWLHAALDTGYYVCWGSMGNRHLIGYRLTKKDFRKYRYMNLITLWLFKYHPVSTTLTLWPFKYHPYSVTVGPCPLQALKQHPFVRFYQTPKTSSHAYAWTLLVISATINTDLAVFSSNVFCNLIWQQNCCTLLVDPSGDRSKERLPYYVTVYQSKAYVYLFWCIDAWLFCHNWSYFWNK